MIKKKVYINMCPILDG